MRKFERFFSYLVFDCESEEGRFELAAARCIRGFAWRKDGADESRAVYLCLQAACISAWLRVSSVVPPDDAQLFMTRLCETLFRSYDYHHPLLMPMMRAAVDVESAEVLQMFVYSFLSALGQASPSQWQVDELVKAALATKLGLSASISKGAALIPAPAPPSALPSALPPKTTTERVATAGAGCMYYGCLWTPCVTIAAGALVWLLLKHAA